MLYLLAQRLCQEKERERAVTHELLKSICVDDVFIETDGSELLDMSRISIRELWILISCLQAGCS